MNDYVAPKSQDWSGCVCHPVWGFLDPKTNVPIPNQPRMTASYGLNGNLTITVDGGGSRV